MTPEEEQKYKQEVNDVLFNNPKSFVSGTRIYIAQDFFALRIDVGTQQFNFAMPPIVAKTLAHFLSEQVKNYEAQVRPIPALNLAVPSPVQMNDLKKLGFDTGEQGDSDAQPPTEPPEKPKK